MSRHHHRRSNPYCSCRDRRPSLIAAIFTWSPRSDLADPAVSSNRPSAGPFRDAALDAKLVALRVGEHHPAGTVRLAVVRHSRGTEIDQPLYFLVAGPVGRLQIQVQPVLDRLQFRETRVQTRPEPQGRRCPAASQIAMLLEALWKARQRRASSFDGRPAVSRRRSTHAWRALSAAEAGVLLGPGRAPAVGAASQRSRPVRVAHHLGGDGVPAPSGNRGCRQVRPTHSTSLSG